MLSNSGSHKQHWNATSRRKGLNLLAQCQNRWEDIDVTFEQEAELVS